MGKYTGQSTLDILTYGFVQYATLFNTVKYTNPVRRKFYKIYFEYLHFNGKEWVETTEIIGGNDNTWYNEYTDPLGNIFLQLVSAGFIGYNIWQQNYFTASTGGIYMLSMFYVGGLNQTNELVPRKNYKISRSFNDTLKVKLSSFLNK